MAEKTELESLQVSLNTAIDFAEWGWTIIANASGGDWDKQSPEWREAASKYRDDFHNTITQFRKPSRACEEMRRRQTA